MRAGDLRHRIDIQTRQTAQDPQTGAVREAWQTFLSSVAASSTPSSVRQFLAAQQVNNELTGTFVIRYREDINASMRVIHHGKAYDILGAIPDPDSNLEYLTLMVKHVPGAANG